MQSSPETGPNNRFQPTALPPDFYADPMSSFGGRAEAEPGRWTT